AVCVSGNVSECIYKYLVGKTPTPAISNPHKMLKCSVLTQCQGGKISTMTLEKQIFLPIYLGRVFRQFPSPSLYREENCTVGNNLIQLLIIPQNGHPTST
ncbi:hypothetical protein AMECASPLE_038214, partial [Ameca splendens]